TPVASRRSGSDTATPMVLVPRSSPISAPRSGQCEDASIRGRMRAGMAPLTMRAFGDAKPYDGVAFERHAAASVTLPDRDRVDHGRGGKFRATDMASRIADAGCGVLR